MTTTPSAPQRVQRGIDSADDERRAQPALLFRPVLDVARGVAAGYAAQPAQSGQQVGQPARATLNPTELAAALAAAGELPPNTFLMLPIAADQVMTPAVRAALLRPSTLRGIILEVVGLARGMDIHPTVSEVRRAGGSLALAGAGPGAAQPGLSSIVELRPAIILLGRDWVRDVEHSTQKQVMIETVGRLASAHDAWILADDVRGPDELHALAELGVPLAQGPIVGGAGREWPALSHFATRTLNSLPTVRSPLRTLVRPVLSTRTVDDAVRLAANLDDSEFVVVVGEDRHPEQLVAAEAGGSTQTSEVLFVNADTPPREALRRALLREGARRELPIAVTDNAGRLLGLVTVRALEDALPAH